MSAAKARLVELGEAKHAAPANIAVIAGAALGVGLLLGRGGGAARILRAVLWPALMRIGTPLLKHMLHGFMEGRE